MKIETEAQRLTHPQARLIPSSIMKSSDFFRNELPDNLIPLMKPQTEEQLLAALQGFKKPHSWHEILRSWLAIAFGHPNLSKETLGAAARHLGLSDKALLEASIALNRQDYLEFLLSQENFMRLVERGPNDFFKMASAHNCLQILHYLESKYPDKLQEMIKKDKFLHLN